MRFLPVAVVSLLAMVASALPSSINHQKRDVALFNALYDDIDVRFTQLMTAIAFFDGSTTDVAPVISGAKDLTSLIRQRVQLLAIQEPLGIGEAIPLVLKVRSSNTVATSFYDMVAKKKAAFDHAKMNVQAAEVLQRNRESFEAITTAIYAKLPPVVNGIAKGSGDALQSKIMDVERTLKESEAPKIGKKI